MVNGGGRTSGPFRYLSNTAWAKVCANYYLYSPRCGALPYLFLRRFSGLKPFNNPLWATTGASDFQYIFLANFWRAFFLITSRRPERYNHNMTIRIQDQRSAEEHRSSRASAMSTKVVSAKADKVVIPFWCVNVPESEWPEECPAFLLNITDRDRDIVSTPDDQYHRPSWEEVQEFISEAASTSLLHHQG